jgi:hypothetical protein
MKKFGIRILMFCIPAFVFPFVTFLFYSYSKSEVESKFQELSGYECLLMGDSQIQRLKGELITTNSKNIASSGEHYYFTYNKLLKIIRSKDSKLRQIILGASIHNFAPIYNRLFNLDFSEGKTSFERYLYFINPTEDTTFIKDHKQLLQLRLIMAAYYTPDWGGLIESSNSNPTKEVIDKTFGIHYSIARNELKFSDSQKTYLYKIDSLCSVHHIDLVLMSTPYHTQYTEQIRPEYFDFYSQTLAKLSHRKHLNFLSDKPDPSLMSDANHLNTQGVNYYSEIIKRELNNQAGGL